MVNLPPIPLVSVLSVTRRDGFLDRAGQRAVGGPARSSGRSHSARSSDQNQAFDDAHDAVQDFFCGSDMARTTIVIRCAAFETGFTNPVLPDIVHPIGMSHAPKGGAPFPATITDLQLFRHRRILRLPSACRRLPSGQWPRPSLRIPAPKIQSRSTRGIRRRLLAVFWPRPFSRDSQINLRR